jgi:hypothetical protein
MELEIGGGCQKARQRTSRLLSSLDKHRLLEGDLVEADCAHPTIPTPVAPASTAYGRRLRGKRQTGFSQIAS